MSGDGSFGSHYRAGEDGTRSVTLTAFEIPVRSGNRIFALRDFIRIHSQTCRTSGLTDLESRRPQDISDTFLLYFSLDLLRPRDKPYGDTFGFPAAADSFGKRPEVALQRLGINFHHKKQQYDKTILWHHPQT